MSSPFTFTISQLKLCCLPSLSFQLTPPPAFLMVLLLFLFLASDDTQKSHRSRHRVHKSSGSSHKTMCRSLSCDSQSKGSISTPRGSTVHNLLKTLMIYGLENIGDAFIVSNFKASALQKVDLSKLEMAALWRYWRHFNLVRSYIVLDWMILFLIRTNRFIRLLTLFIFLGGCYS